MTRNNMHARRAPVDPVTLVRPTTPISLDQGDYVANGWRGQRKFQLGFKLFF
ncbi:hypothetical protein BH18ACI5_BH18ACI5_16860 [soil metagenome]